MNSHFVSSFWWFNQATPRAWPAWRRAGVLAVGLASVAGAALSANPVVPSAAPAMSPAQLSARVENAARQLLLEQATSKGLVDPVVELRSATSAAPLPPCPEPVTVEALDTRSPTRMRFAAVCTGAEGWQREWTVRAELSAKVVVAAADVPANQMLAATDLTVERRRVTDMADVLSTTSQAAGQSSSRALRVGQPVQPRWLAAPVLVRRGENVIILARNGGIEVTAAGEALEAGRLHDVLRVRNATTGRMIRARVIDAGVVEPENMGGSVRPQSAD